MNNIKKIFNFLRKPFFYILIVLVFLMALSNHVKDAAFILTFSLTVAFDKDMQIFTKFLITAAVIACAFIYFTTTR